MRKVLYILGELEDSDLQWMVDAGTLRQVAAGTAIIEEDVALDSTFIVVAGELCWFKGIATTSAPQISLASSFTPVAGVIFAVLLVGERPNMAVLIGGGIIVLGIVVAQLGPIVERRAMTRRAPTTDEAVNLEGGVNFKGV